MTVDPTIPIMYLRAGCRAQLIDDANGIAHWGTVSAIDWADDDTATVTVERYPKPAWTMTARFDTPVVISRASHDRIAHELPDHWQVAS